jgi:hypothetical protein
MFKSNRLYSLPLVLFSLALALSACAGENFAYYEGQFDPWDPAVHGPWVITSSAVELEINYKKDTVTGKGTLVAESSSEFVINSDWRSTQNMVFEGTYDPVLKDFEGVVHVTGGNVCLKACEGAENQVYDYPASWKGKFVEGKLVGEVDAIGSFALDKQQ